MTVDGTVSSVVAGDAADEVDGVEAHDVDVTDVGDDMEVVEIDDDEVCDVTERGVEWLWLVRAGVVNEASEVATVA